MVAEVSVRGKQRAGNHGDSLLPSLAIQRHRLDAAGEFYPQHVASGGTRNARARRKIASHGLAGAVDVLLKHRAQLAQVAVVGRALEEPRDGHCVTSALPPLDMNFKRWALAR